MKVDVLWQLAKYVYRELIREVLLKAFDDPNAEWDDILMDICDRVFDYTE